MKPEILVTVPLYPPTLSELEREYVVRKLWSASDPHAFLRDACAGIRAAVTTGLSGFSRGQMEALPALELIACYGTPRGTVDFAAARERKVAVTNTPDSTAAPVADLVMGLVLALMRRLYEGDRFVRAGKWPRLPVPVGRGLAGRTCGIVGLGRIGSEIAKRAEACGMKVGYHGPARREDVAYPYYADLEEMARRSDCLVVVCPLLPETRGMINARVLEALGPEGFLVNAARGPVVDQAALIAALRDGRIAGAGLDVYWDEPQVPAELIAMENVVLTPHMGTSIREIRDERGRKVLANLRAFFAGEPLVTPLERNTHR
jgi:lactate dehydrogenase-like 2-hydroxyacid dehydrogenase